MTYTKPQFDAMRKDQLVETAVELQSKLDASNSTPLTAATLQKRLLDLTEKSISVKSVSEESARAYNLSVLELEASTNLAKEQLNLEYRSSLGKEAVNLAELFAELENKAELAKKDLTYGLEVAEIEASEKLAVINAKIEEAQLEFDTLTEKLKEESKVLKLSHVKTIESIKEDHSRNLESLEYENKLAIRDEKLPVAEKIAKAFNKELVNSDEYVELVGFKAREEEEVASAISEAVAKAVNANKSTQDQKFRELESTSKNTISLLENDKKHLQSSMIEKDARIKDVEDRLKQVPAQIASAVEAAKSNTTINQSAGK